MAFLYGMTNNTQNVLIVSSEKRMWIVQHAVCWGYVISVNVPKLILAILAHILTGTATWLFFI